MKFSQRIGVNPVEKILQANSIDSELKNGLWNSLTIFYWDSYRSPTNEFMNQTGAIKRSNIEELIYLLWIHYFKKPVDSIEEYWGDCLRELRNYYFEAEWWQIYDFLEFIADYGNEHVKNNFIEACNIHLSMENSAYRFVNGKLSAITSTEEIQSIETAIISATPYGGVKKHLTRAVELYSDKSNPDYRNSIKESISAVESLAKQVSGDEKATLGTILNKLEKERKMHPALKRAFSALYGYTSDTDGIRHALLEEESLTKTDAKFMLVCCSAFVNYVIETIN